MNKIQKEKILIIADDVKTNRLIIKNIFKNEYTIYEAENGLEVMELFSTCPHVEALILDIHMPKMDGMEVLMRMQEDENLKAIPTVVITASADDETQIKILTFGITDVISKPFSPIIMWHRLNNLVSRKEAEKLSIKNAQIQTEMRLLRTDTLTGISNKQGFITDVTHLLTNNPQKDYIIVRWDVDNFKLYNDSLGIQIGNQYLKDIGDFYRLRKNDNGLIVYARYDNEHFVCCFEEEIFSLELEIEKITEYINSIKQGNHILKPRFGVVMVDDKSIDVSLLCDRASLALKTTKNTFATSFAWYDDSLRTAMLEEQEIINQMNTALENCEFVPYLQPQFDYKNNKIIGAEILARWKHPIKGLMPPSRFIPLFERNGFISPLDCHIWEETFKLLRKWIDTGVEPIKLSVNISRCDFFNLDIFTVFSALLEKYQIPTHLICVEITETACVQNFNAVLKAVEPLRKLGIDIHLDDFGSGYSSLTVLSTLPLDLIKLDRAFLSGDFLAPSNVNLMKAIVNISTIMNIPLLIEGVEKEEQAKFMLELGCRAMQGYYFEVPLPVEDFEKKYFSKTM